MMNRLKRIWKQIWRASYEAKKAYIRKAASAPEARQRRRELERLDNCF